MENVLIFWVQSCMVLSRYVYRLDMVLPPPVWRYQFAALLVLTLLEPQPYFGDKLHEI